MAEKTHISPWPQRLSAPESHSSHLHTLVNAYQVPGAEITDMAATLQSEGGKEVFIGNLLFQALLLGGSFFIHSFIYQFIHS